MSLSACVKFEVLVLELRHRLRRLRLRGGGLLALRRGRLVRGGRGRVVGRVHESSPSASLRSCRFAFSCRMAKESGVLLL